MPAPIATAADSPRHARLFALIHQQARAEYTALRLQRRSRRAPVEAEITVLMALAARSWTHPAPTSPRG